MRGFLLFFPDEKRERFLPLLLPRICLNRWVSSHCAIPSHGRGLETSLGMFRKLVLWVVILCVIPSDSRKYFQETSLGVDFTVLTLLGKVPLSGSQSA